MEMCIRDSCQAGNPQRIGSGGGPSRGVYNRAGKPSAPFCGKKGLYIREPAILQKSRLEGYNVRHGATVSAWTGRGEGAEIKGLFATCPCHETDYLSGAVPANAMLSYAGLP